MMQVYQLQPLDHTAVIITGATLCLALGSILLVFYFFRRGGGSLGRKVVPGLSALLMIVPCVVLYAFSPRSIILRNDTLVLNCPLTHSAIPLAEITNVRLTRSDDAAGAYRTFGVGGLFGYFGYFKNDKLGTFRMFSTSQKHAVLIETRRECVITSPALPESFVADVQSRIR